MNERLRELLNDSNKYALEAKKSVLGRGGEISLSAGLEDLPDAIRNIPVGSSLAIKEDSTVAYRKIVPIKAEEYALVKKIGGLSYKCNNLITFPYTEGDVGAVKILQGITYTVLEGGGIHTKGTTGDGIYSSFTINTIDNASELIPGQTYILGNVPDGLNMVVTYYNANNELKYWGNGAKLVWDSAYTIKNIYFQVLPNRTVDTILYPMLNEGTTALPYEPYFKGLRDTKVTSLEGRGAQLIPFPYRIGGAGTVRTSNGITLTVLEDGKIQINGTASSTATFIIMSSYSPVTGTVFLSGCDEGNDNTFGITIHFWSGNEPWQGSLVAGTLAHRHSPLTVNAEDYGCICVYVFVQSGVTVNNVILEPMLNYGTEAAPFEPYKADARDTFPIPEEIINREDWGRGVNENYHNAIEYIDGRWYYIPRTKRKVFDGSAAHWFAFNWVNGWEETTDKYCYAFDCLTAQLGKHSGPQTSICNMFKNADDAQYAWDENSSIGNYCDATTAPTCYFVTSFPTLTEWLAHLAELYASGNPLIIEYALAEPIEEDITHLITRSKFLKTEDGGSIIAHNEHESAVPTTIKYTVKVG